MKLGSKTLDTFSLVFWIYHVLYIAVFPWDLQLRCFARVQPLCQRIAGAVSYWAMGRAILGQPQELVSLVFHKALSWAAVLRDGLSKAQLVLEPACVREQHKSHHQVGPTCCTSRRNGVSLSPKTLAGDIASKTGDLKINGFKSTGLGMLLLAGTSGTNALHHCTSAVIGVCHYSSMEESVGYLLHSWSLETKSVLKPEL